MESTAQPTDSSDFRALREITASWRACLEHPDNGEDDQVVAGHMVGVVLQADRSPEALQHLDPVLMNVFDVVTELETPLVSQSQRPRLWANVKKGVAQLERKYATPR